MKNWDAYWGVRRIVIEVLYQDGSLTVGRGVSRTIDDAVYEPVQQMVNQALAPRKDPHHPGLKIYLKGVA